MRSFLLVLLTLTLPLPARAGVIKPDAIHFKKSGSLESFQWAPDDYSEPLHPNPFRYDIFYYIPTSIQNHQKVKSLVFNHGGGASTKTREGSIQSVQNYTTDLMKLADELGFVAILPSANGLNWGGHTVPMLQSLLKLMRKELDLDPDRIGLSGHSMGGMGITRSYLWLADQFAFFMPQAAGVAFENFKSQISIDEHLNKAFNVAYIHLQGTRDHFKQFIERAHKHSSEMQSLEISYGRKSRFDLHLYDTNHQYKLDVFRDRLEQAFQKKRDLYQKNLYGSLHLHTASLAENGIRFRYRGSPRYFWVQGITHGKNNSERLNFRTKIQNNRIMVDLEPAEGFSIQCQKLKLYLRQGMVDLKSKVYVYINGIPAFIRNPTTSASKTRSMDPSDTGFLFDLAIDVPIPYMSPATIAARRFSRSWGISR